MTGYIPVDILGVSVRAKGHTNAKGNKMKTAAFNPPSQLGKYTLHTKRFHERFDEWTKFPLSETKWQELDEATACQYDHDGMVTNDDCGGLEGWKVIECWGRLYAVYVTYTDADGTFVWTACPAHETR